MGYNLKSLTSELVNKNLADGGLVAWGQASGGAFFGAMGAALASMHTISMKDGNILVIPFTNKQIKYSEATIIKKSEIKTAKVSGLLSGKLKIKLNNGKSLSFGITQGKGAVKQILTSLGF